MKKLQKLLSLIMVIFALSITGCSNNNSTPASSNETTDVTQTEEVQTSEIEEVEETTEIEEAEEATETEEAEETTETEEVEEATETEEVEETTDVEDLEVDAETSATETNEHEDSGDFEQLAPPEAGETVATIKVAGFGDIKVKFFPEQAPLAVENFVTLASEGYYNGIIFHRVINDFMIQGGDPTGTGMGGSSIWGDPFVNEDSTDLYHLNGALSMANAGPDTNGSQFFIVNSSPVFPQSSTRREYSDYAHDMYTTIGGTAFLDGGYTVFGQVYEGLEIVEAIMQVKTTGSEGSTPVDDVVIESIVISEY